MQIAEAWNADRRRFNADALELAQLLHNWDPIGVYEGDDQNAPPDEYDDLVTPILAALRVNSDWESLAVQLRELLASDYGLTGVEDVDAFAQRVIAWRSTRGMNDDR